MAELETSQELVHDPQRLGRWQSGVFFKQPGERSATNEFHNDEREFVCLTVIENRNDIGMTQPASSTRLPSETLKLLARFIVIGIGELDCLDGDAAANNRIARIVNRPSRTTAENALQFIFSERLKSHGDPD